MLLAKKKDVLVLGECPTDGLDDATITTKAKYSIYFTKSKNKICLSWCNNGSNSFCMLME